MKPHYAMSIILICSALLLSSCSAQQALWIEVKGDGEHKTIAVTEGIARRLLDSKDMHVNFSRHEKNDLVTREQLRAVLDRRERSITAHGDHGKEVTTSMKSINTPGKNNDKNRLVLEVYKKGKQTFRIALPELEIKSADEKNELSIDVDLDWKEWLPFLAKEGGAVFIKDHDDDTEVWVYVE